MSLAPNSRIRNAGSGGGLMSYLSPGDSNEVFAIPLSFQFAMYDSFTGFAVNTYDQPSPLNTVEGWRDAPSTFDSDSFSEFHQYPTSSTALKVTPSGGFQNRQRFATPFNQGASTTVTEIAAASSTYGGAIPDTSVVMSGLTPSIMSQYASVFTYGMSSSDKNAAYAEFNDAYQNVEFDNLDICSETPFSCSSNDGRLLNG